MSNVDCVATAEPVAENICAVLGPEDALAVAMYILALVAARTGVGLDKLVDAFAIVASHLKETGRV